MECRNFLFAILILLVIVLMSKVHAYGNNFSCPYGTEGACINYGDKICSSLSKCVDSNATCFDANTCGYKGFVCKSQLDDLAYEYDDLLTNCKKVAQEHDSIVNNYNQLLLQFQILESEYEDLVNCIYTADSLEDAEYCI